MSLASTHSRSRWPRLMGAAFWSSMTFSMLMAAPAGAEVGATCASDANCGADERCEVTSTSGSGGCTKEGECEAPKVVEGKTCVARVRTCTQDSDCPSPSTCADAGDGSVGFDGTNETRTASTKVCTWKPKACSADAECGDAGYACLEVGREESCGGGTEPAPPPRGGTGGAAGSGSSGSGGTETGGAANTDSAAAPIAPLPAPDERPAPDAPAECTTTRVLKACMPKPIACTSGAQCASGWSCVDASRLGAAYETKASGGFCMPEGIKLALTGHVALDAAAFYGPVRDGGDESGAGGLPKGGLGSGGGNSAPPTADDTSAKSDGGCSLGGHGAQRSLSLIPLAMGIALTLRRRLRGRK